MERKSCCSCSGRCFMNYCPLAVPKVNHVATKVRQDYACRYGQARTVKRRFTSAIFGVFKSPNAEENASVSVKKEVCDKVNLALGGHI